VAVLIAIGVAAGLTALVRAVDPQPGRGLSPALPVTTTSAGAPQPTTGGISTTSGKSLFLRDCAWCHGDQGQGTSRAPSLQHDGYAGADFWLRTGRMPLNRPSEKVQRSAPSYPSSSIRALAQYVGTLGTGPEVPTVSAGDPVEGQKLFVANCAACHSSSGTGMILQDGTWAPSLYPTASQQIAEAIRLGPGQMPPFASGQMDDQQVDDVVSYVQELGGDQVKGGHPLDQLGPIAEGLLLFLLPLPLLVLIIRMLGKKAGQ
jgi:ubiquinol-cytochrome c reductase cytochrome c subunit